jgi:hypothetical protein
VEKDTMVKTLKEKDIPEPWFTKKSKGVTITRATSKQMAQHPVVEDEIVQEPVAKGDARQKAKAKEDVAGKGRKKTKGVPPATAEVVMGRSKYVVPDPEEMKRKMMADAEACGRVVRSLSQPALRRSCPTTVVTETIEDQQSPELVTGEPHSVMAHSGSPIPEMPAAEEGMEPETRACVHVIAYEGRITPSGRRSGSEAVHEERQHAEGSARRLQDKGKRKVIEDVVLNSTSSEHSDSAKHEQMYGRLNRSPSPIILKEQASCIVYHSLPQFTTVYHKFTTVDHSLPQVDHSLPQVDHSLPQVYHNFPQVYHRFTTGLPQGYHRFTTVSWQWLVRTVLNRV